MTQQRDIKAVEWISEHVKLQQEHDDDDDDDACQDSAVWSFNAASCQGGRASDGCSSSWPFSLPV